MAAPLGIDIAGVLDVDEYLSFADPGRSAADAVMRSLFHEPGALWWAPDRGWHLAQHLHGFFDPDAIESGVRAQVEADERVESADVKAEQFGTDCRLTIEVVFTSDPSATTFTISVDQAANIILEQDGREVI
jgi:hypothetical protein